MNLLSKISDGRTDLIFDYLEKNGDLNSKNQYGQSLISLAAYYGDVTAIKYLESKGVPLTHLGNNFDLNGAAFHGHWQLCQYLLEKGADPNVTLKDNGESPLHSCLSKINRRSTIYIVRLLLAHGADPNIKTIPRRETGAFMRDAYTYGETPLHRAAAFGTVEIIQTLIEAGADKTIKDDNGDSPLSWASWHSRPGYILAPLTYGSHRLHQAHIETNASDHGFGYGAGIMKGLLGKVHIGDKEN